MIDPFVIAQLVVEYLPFLLLGAGVVLAGVGIMLALKP